MKNETKGLEDKIKKINKVTANDIQKMAKTIFMEKNLNLAVIGPFKDDKKFKEVLKF
jgi:predicted Zn-dependent peptidase